MKQIALNLDNPGKKAADVKAKVSAAAKKARTAVSAYVSKPWMLAGLIITGGILAAYIARWRDTKAREMGWDASKLAWGQLGVLFLGAVGLAYGAKKSPELRRNAVPLALVMAAAAGPMAAEAAGAAFGVNLTGSSSAAPPALPAAASSTDAVSGPRIGQYRRTRSSNAVNGIMYDVTDGADPVRVNGSRGLGGPENAYQRISAVFAPQSIAPFGSRSMYG